MTDPTDGLVSFQHALLNGEIQLQRGQLDPEIFVHLDEPTPGTHRFTYVRLDRQIVTALVMLVPTEPIDGIACFQIGCAVPPKYRGQGRAKEIMRASIAELWNGVSRNGFQSLCIEGVVGIDNKASQRAATAVLSDSPAQVTDSVSGLPAFHYVRRLGA